eukprot:EG_transcript_9094
MNWCGAVDDHQPFAHSEDTSSWRSPHVSSELPDDPQPQTCRARTQRCALAAVRTVRGVGIFVPFLIAVLIQTLRNRRVVRLARAEAYIECGTWVVAWLWYAVLATLPLALLHQSLLTGHPFFLGPGELVGICYAPVLVLNGATALYIFHLPRQPHQALRLCFTAKYALGLLVNALHPLVEAAQLYALGVSIASDGLAIESPLQQWLAQWCFLGPLSNAQMFVCGGCMVMYALLLGYLTACRVSATSLPGMLAVQVLPGMAFLSLANGHLSALLGAWGRPLLAAALVQSFLFYVTTAPFVAAYKVTDRPHVPRTPGVRTTARFLAMERAWKALLVVVLFLLRTRVPSSARLQFHILFGMVGVLLLAVASAQPCSIPRLNWARGYTLSCVLFGYAYTVEGDSGPALAVIPIAWVAFSLMYCVAYVALPPERPHAQELQSPREIFANKTDLSDL